MKHAVCVIIRSAGCHIIRTPDKYFAVSRRDDSTQWGFPGGKVDHGESHCEAIMRETREEIGIELDMMQLVPVFSTLCRSNGDGVDYWVTTYLHNNPVSEDFFIGQVQLEHGLSGGFLTAEELCSPEMSPFAEYNTGAFASALAYQG